MKLFLLLNIFSYICKLISKIKNMEKLLQFTPIILLLCLMLTMFFYIVNHVIFMISYSIFIKKTVQKNIDFINDKLNKSVSSEKYIILSKNDTIEICQLFNKFNKYFILFIGKKKLKNSIFNNFSYLYGKHNNKKILTDLNEYELYKYMN